MQSSCTAKPHALQNTVHQQRRVLVHLRERTINHRLVIGTVWETAQQQKDGGAEESSVGEQLPVCLSLFTCAPFNPHFIFLPSQRRSFHKLVIPQCSFHLSKQRCLRLASLAFVPEEKCHLSLFYLPLP